MLPTGGPGDLVALWKNKINLASPYKVSQLTSGSCPVWQTTTVNYDGAGDTLSKTALTLASNSGMTLAVGAAVKVASVSNVRFISFSAGDSVLFTTPNGVTANFNGRGFNGTIPLSLVQPNTIIVTSQANLVPITIRMDGVEQTDSAAGTAGLAFDQIVLLEGAAKQANISQVVFVNRVLSAQEIAQLEAYIGSKQ